MNRVLPILFNTEMVRAILDGRKTDTRRAVKGFIPDNAMFGYTAFTPKGKISCRGNFSVGYGEKFFKLPYQKGDILYVRETWAFIPCIGCNRDYIRKGGPMNCYDYEAVEYDDGSSISDGCFIYRADCQNTERIVWHPSIHMPKQAARIWLEVTDVRVERLQEITEEQAICEGCSGKFSGTGEYIGSGWDETPTEQFSELWNSTIKKLDLDRYGWEANPWVWVIEFERCKRPGEYAY